MGFRDNPRLLNKDRENSHNQWYKELDALVAQQDRAIAS